jgi:hypothetical protein
LLIHIKNITDGLSICLIILTKYKAIICKEKVRDNRSISSHPYTLDSPSSCPLRIRPDNTSAQRIKRYGGNGFPCLSPHWGTKLEVGFPSIRIAKETMVTHLIIVLTRVIEKPIETRVFCKNCHSTLS